MRIPPLPAHWRSRSGETRCCLVGALEIISGVTAGTRVPVLWICGPAGVGKSTVSWQRFIARHGRRDDRDELLQEISGEIRLMDQSSFADACVDTTDVHAGDVPALVRAACKDWPGFTGRLEEASGQGPVQPGPAAGGRVALITGPAGVGKSTIGFRFYLQCLNAGLTTGYVDLSQIGFLQPAAAGDPGSQRLKARNLAAIWRNYQAAGATHLVATGVIASQADLRLYAGELTGTDIALTRLHAGSHVLRRRIMSRGAGGSWPEPGDSLCGQPAEFLTGVADQAVQAAEALDRSDVGGVAVDTTSLSPDESASMIRDAIDWPGGGLEEPRPVRFKKEFQLSPAGREAAILARARRTIARCGPYPLMGAVAGSGRPNCPYRRREK
jgi:adenylylsulfate kinase-like enzyme